LPFADPNNGHVCLLIGCNRKTAELTERWITVEEARALSQGDLGAIVH